ncbi:hypothetical protein BDQ12DRAFT_683640 [Crucibulum laeve]|uniref:Uncharacterized protein n=1 Tax=Crucibulum laeve TaxID=68775 RepID=A0A5C3MB79_9AGAR|nr:hypothetical protein BDQ12DRAFT_683640 [Crucibulum laeve]
MSPLFCVQCIPRICAGEDVVLSTLSGAALVTRFEVRGSEVQFAVKSVAKEDHMLFYYCIKPSFEQSISCMMRMYISDFLPRPYHRLFEIPCHRPYLSIS